MCPCNLTAGITALACLLAEGKSAEELALLGSVLTQLGDTLLTMSAQRALCEKK